ncbi:PKD domain-containing protein [Candidatus Woesearchaeota archaeon]|nr:PKD domain-containing protein [Candidatus Woesearchaeota archaeon]
MKQLTYLLLFIMLSISVNAAVDVTYLFDQQNVAVVAVDCLNADCSSVQNFSGQIIKGPQSTDGSVILRYPDSLATQFGYAEFFVSQGFRPLVGKHNWSTEGQSGIATASQSASFSKMQNVCKAVVSKLNVSNPVEPYKPVVINTTAQLDGTTASAFQLLNTGVAYIPPSLLQEYWGADTVVKLEILNGTNIVESQQKSFAAATNNAIIAGTSVPVSFTYIPDSEGNFVAKVTASVVDNQCRSQKDQSSEKSFSVATLQDQLYSILRNIRVNNPIPSIGDTVTVSVDRITNYAVNNSILTPVPAILEFVVMKGPFMQVVSSVTKGASANPDAVNFVTEMFDFIPLSADVHTVVVRARANVSFTTANPEITAEESIRINLPLVPLEVSVIPVSGTAINSSSLTITATTNRMTACRWGFSDVDFDGLVNNFVTSDGLSHSAVVTGFGLGNNAVFVACDEQSSAENINLNYFVENIIENSVLTNSTVTNSIITNSTITNAVITNATITNNVITAGQITINGFTYDATINGQVQLSQLMPLAPVASFTQSDTIAQQGREVVFTSTSTDANIPGPLNDTLSFVWDFGDSTTASGAIATKRYTSEGTFTVTLRVTDRFALSSIAQKTVTVVRGNSGSNNGGGGGSRSNARSASNTDSVVVAATNPPVKKAAIKIDDDSKTVPVVQRETEYTPVKLSSVKKNNDLFVIKLLIFLNVFLLGITAVLTSTLIRRRKSL